MIKLETLAEFLNEVLKVDQFKDDLNGIYQSSNRPIRCLGLIREPWSEVADWVCSNQIDALFCHRPWKLSLEQLPNDTGVLAYHLSFDEALTIGYNPWLANQLGMKNLAVLGTKRESQVERPIGMIGDISSQSFYDYHQQVSTVFDGTEEIWLGAPKTSEFQISRVAVVGATSAELVQMAAAQGADLYITGQFRSVAKTALQSTGMSCIAIGHQRSEEWGIQALAELIRQRWPALQVVLPIQ
jgi:putative NIF3 family GTP cyclohydrolase 1 type 2